MTPTCASCCEDVYSYPPDMDALLAAIAARTMLMRDSEGRPLGECKAGPDRMRDVPLDLRTCPYRGSRYRHKRPMNVSALKQVSAHWEDVLGALAYLRELYSDWSGTNTLRIIDVWQTGHLTNSIADFALMRAWSSYGDHELPAAIGSLYKVSLGITSTCFRAWLDRVVTFETATSVDFLIDFAETRGQLIGPDQVCGGSEAMIREMLDIALRGDAGRYPRNVARQVVADELRFRQFCNATSALRMLRYAFERQEAVLRCEMARMDLPHGVRALLTEGLSGSVMPFVASDEAARELMLDDLLGPVFDTSFNDVEARAGVASIRDTWRIRRLGDTSEVEHALTLSGEHSRLKHSVRSRVIEAIAQYISLERVFSDVARLFKMRAAESIGISRENAIAREHGFIQFVPMRPTRRSMRSALAEAFQIVVAAPDGYPCITVSNHRA